MEIGSQFITKKSGICTVVEYTNCKDVLVEFECGFRKVCAANAIRNGNVKNPYYPSVQGVGYLGEGPYITSKKKILTQESIPRQVMLQRCYDKKFLLKHPSYEDNYTCDFFHNFQNFAHWCQSAIGFMNKSWCLDKDIIVKGNKEYGPDYCSFVPYEINNLLISSKVCRGDYPIGVSYNKIKGLYSACCHKNGVQVTVGDYHTPEEAFSAYKIFKEDNIKQVATKWKNQIDHRVYESLMKWGIDSGD